MARFDAYPNPGPTAADIPYLTDVQSDLLNELDSRIVVPLRRPDRSPAKKIHGALMPVLVVAGIECVLETPKLAAVPRKILKKPHGSRADQQDTITGALDFQFSGF